MHPSIEIGGILYQHEGSVGAGAECFRNPAWTPTLLHYPARVVLVWDSPLQPFPTRIFRVGTRNEAVGKAGAGKFRVCGECHGEYFI